MNTRIHKYKVYDTELKKFVSGFEAFDKVCGWENDETGSHIILRQEKYIVLQWTGLLDSKGVEIYEGDIAEKELEIYDNFGQPTGEFRKVRGVIKIYPRIGVKILDHGKIRQLSISTEIIGSIHTTPELLKV